MLVVSQSNIRFLVHSAEDMRHECLDLVKTMLSGAVETSTKETLIEKEGNLISIRQRLVFFLIFNKILNKKTYTLYRTFFPTQ